MDWRWFAAWLGAGVMGGLLFWALARLGLVVAGWLPQRMPFAADLLAAAGDRERLRHRTYGRELAVVLAALLASVVCTLLAALTLSQGSLPGWPAWLWAAVLAVALAVLGLGAYRVFQLVLARRQARFAWAAKAAVGNMLKRLNFSGNRVFHEVLVEGAVIDHVVLGAKGAFAINVVARSVPTKDGNRPLAELKNGKLVMAGAAEALPVGDAARNMTLLSAALTKIAGHRVPVRSVLAVPGWNSVPTSAGNHLVLNENNLAMLTSWNTPDAYLMDEDCLAIQSFLHEASRAARMS